MKKKKKGFLWRIRITIVLEKYLVSPVYISFEGGRGNIEVKYKNAEHFQKVSSQLAGLNSNQELNDEATQTLNVSHGPELRGKIETRLATKVSGETNHKDGGGVIQIFFGSREELERICRIILGVRPPNQLVRQGDGEFPKLDLDDPEVQREWLWKIFAPYSNPWWTDPRDFAHDQLTRKAAQEWFEGQCIRDIRRPKRRRQAFVFCVFLVLIYFAFSAFIGWMEPLWGSPLLILLLVISLKKFRRNWAEEHPYQDFYKLKKQLRQRSADDYRTWFASLSTSDPGLYSQILTWEQNEEMLRIQRGVLAASQAAAAASQAAAAAARTNAANTTAIRNQIKYGRE